MSTVCHVVLLVALATLSSSSQGFLRFGEAAVFIKPERELHGGVLRANRVSRSSEHAPEEPNAEEGHEKASEGDEKAPVHHEKDKGFTTVLGFGAAVILFALSFAMANHSNKKISLFTWRCLDNVISIFLAVLIFQALDEIVVDSGLLPKEHVVIASFIYAVVLLTLAVGLSKVLSKDESDNKNLAIFAASSAHFVGFGFMHASTLAVEHHGHSVTYACVVFLAVCAFVASMYVGIYYLKKHFDMYEDSDRCRELIEKVDDIETDAGSMAVSICWTLLVCFYLTEEFQDLEEEENIARKDRRLMMIYCIMITILGSLFILFMCNEESAVAEGSYFKKRLTSFCSSAMAMCMAWAWLVWGKWYFHEHSFEAYPMFSRIWFAFIVSMVAITVIVVLGTIQFKPERADRALKFEKEEMLLILTVSLVAGWSWEEAFDSGIETITEATEAEGHWKGTYKLLACAIMVAVVLPVQVIYFKPLALAREKECGESGTED